MTVKQKPRFIPLADDNEEEQEHKSDDDCQVNKTGDDTSESDGDQDN